jgi:dolichol-phosphate mannosyltransferase
MTSEPLSKPQNGALHFSLVVPVFNEEAMVPLLAKILPTHLAAMSSDWEIVLVDDGSSDGTLALLREWAITEPRIVVVQLTRNFGHQNAVLAGLANTRGKFIGIIDGDLQDPPEVLALMLERIEVGVDVVYGVRKARKEGGLLRFAYWLAYRLINGMADQRLPLDSGDFCAMRREVANELMKLGEQHLFLRGLRSWVGFVQEAFPYERHARAEGSPKYGVKQLWGLLRNGIYGFTTMPLRMIRWIGALVLAGSIAYSVFILLALWLGSSAPRGFATLALGLCIFGGAQLLALGIIGEYVARIHDEVRGRPRYIVKTVHSACERP